MTSEELNNFITDVISVASDQGALTERLENLRTDYNEQLANISNLTENVTNLTNNNESLRNVNNKFMLKLGNLSEFNDNKDDEKFKDDKKEEIPTYDSLFNKEGELI